MKFAYVLLIIGAVLVAYSTSLAPYKDERAFNERYVRLSEGQSKEYWQLRDEMLTHKFQLQDYGGTAIALAIIALLAGRKGIANIHVPNARWVLVTLAVLAPLLTTAAYVFDILQGFNRGEFPHWADSIGIPLMGAPIQFLILLIWALGHLALLRRQYHSSIPIVFALSRNSNIWLLILSALTAALVAMFAALGLYWYAVPGLVWLYFYLSLAAVRRARHGA